MKQFFYISLFLISFQFVSFDSVAQELSSNAKQIDSLIRVKKIESVSIVRFQDQSTVYTSAVPYFKFSQNFLILDQEYYFNLDKLVYFSVGEGLFSGKRRMVVYLD